MEKAWFRWAVIILTVVNISMIAGFTYRAYMDKPPEGPQSLPELPDRGFGRVLQDSLGLTHQQHLKFRQARRTFHVNARKIAVNLQRTRLTLLQEMSSPKPDSSQLQALADSIGWYHSELKKLTVDFYLELKQECSPAQKEKLYGVFRALMHADHIKMPGRPRHHKQRFHRNRKKPMLNRNQK